MDGIVYCHFTTGPGFNRSAENPRLPSPSAKPIAGRELGPYAP